MLSAIKPAVHVVDLARQKIHFLVGLTGPKQNNLTMEISKVFQRLTCRRIRARTTHCSSKGKRGYCMDFLFTYLIAITLLLIRIAMSCFFLTTNLQ